METVGKKLSVYTPSTPQGWIMKLPLHKNEHPLSHYVNEMCSTTSSPFSSRYWVSVYVFCSEKKLSNKKDVLQFWSFARITIWQLVGDWMWAGRGSAVSAVNMNTPICWSLCPPKQTFLLYTICVWNRNNGKHVLGMVAFLANAIDCSINTIKIFFSNVSAHVLLMVVDRAKNTY